MKKFCERKSDLLDYYYYTRIAENHIYPPRVLRSCIVPTLWECPNVSIRRVGMMHECGSGELVAGAIYSWIMTT